MYFSAAARLALLVPVLAAFPSVLTAGAVPLPDRPPVSSSASAVPGSSADDNKAPAKPPAKPDEKKPDEKKPAKGPKPYKDVITADAKSESGLFKVHRIDEKVYWEIPVDMLDRDMLWQTEIEQVSTGRGYSGTSAGARVIRWTRRNDKIYIRTPDYTLRSDDKGAIQTAIRDSSLDPIIQAFDVEAEGDNKSAVIDVTHLLNSDIPEFGAGRALGASGVDASRSYIDKVKAFPTNIESKVLMSFSGGGGGDVSALVHYSLDLLPQTPMKGRLFDSRVGFFNEGFQDYGGTDHRVMERAYVTRYRLEKKDPTAAVSDPVKPLVYYISREVPEKWRPYMKEAVEAWNEAFLQAGFSNAIVCKDVPTLEEDPNWDPEDARFSVIRWAPTETENAMGPHVHDPRSGEIISAHIIIWHNVLKLGEDWYFNQVSPLDPRAQKLPIPDALMGEILRYIVCHEVGHTLGLQHNFKGSSSYTIAQLRSRDFTAKYGDEASIMDYGRFNYVAQPGDNAVLIPRIGPYDKFAIEWGYKPLPGRSTPEDEKTDLDLMAARQIGNPQLRFGNYDHPEDPTLETEDLSNDPVEATRLGLKNIARVAKLLVPATTTFGEDYTLLTDEYHTLFGQRQTELNHVVKLVGGVVQTDYHSGRGGDVFQPVPRARQEQAVQFLIQNAFTTPHELLLPDILYRIESSGAVDMVGSSQRSILAGLLGDSRIDRLFDAQAMYPANAYPVSQLVKDLQTGIWSELTVPHPAIDIYRRNLQKNYLSVYRDKLSGDGPRNDLKPIAKDSLRQLAKSIDEAVPRAKDNITAMHLLDCRKEIEDILNPKFGSAPAQRSFFVFGAQSEGTSTTRSSSTTSSPVAPSPADPLNCFLYGDR